MDLDIQIIDGGGAYIISSFTQSANEWMKKHPSCKSGEMNPAKITHLERKMLKHGFQVEVIIIRRDYRNEITQSQGRWHLEDNNIYMIPI